MIPSPIPYRSGSGHIYWAWLLAGGAVGVVLAGLLAMLPLPLVPGWSPDAAYLWGVLLGVGCVLGGASLGAWIGLCHEDARERRRLGLPPYRDGPR